MIMRQLCCFLNFKRSDHYLNRLFRLRSAYRTCISTCAAIKALVGIDHILAIAFADSFCRALLCTCAACYTIITNYICHNIFLLNIDLV